MRCNEIPGTWLDAIQFEWWDSTIIKVRDGRDLALFILRNSPVLIGISQNGEFVQVVVSIGGSEVASATAFVGDTLKPDRLVFGAWGGPSNNKALNVCPMLWYGGRMDEATPLSVAQMAADLKSLAMLYELNVITPPGV